jgi:hypothetical protein
MLMLGWIFLFSMVCFTLNMWVYGSINT